MKRSTPFESPARSRAAIAGAARDSWTILLVALVHCTGNIGDNAHATTGGVAPLLPATHLSEQIPGSRGSGDAGAGVPFAPFAATMKRLTVSQYQNTVRDLFGGAVAPPTDIEVDTLVDGFATLGASQEGISQQGTEQYDAAARALAHQALQDAAARSSLVGCTPADSSDPCIRQFLANFGMRAWRRPLDPSELDAHAGIVRTVAPVAAAAGQAEDVWGGLEYAIAAMLLSPKFVFRVEVGEDDPQAKGRLRYTAFEMAARLSFFLWDAAPDSDLLAAAGNGSLLTVAGVRSEGERLLASPRARVAARSFFSQYLRLGALDHLTKDAPTYPLATSTLGPAMRTELEMNLEHLAFNGADFRLVFDQRTTFVNAELAQLYGVAHAGPADTFTQVTFDAASPRAGLLGSAGFLALNAGTILTSPTKRGRFIRQQLLCQDIPPPPPNVMASFIESAGATGPRTMRDRVAQHMKDPVCATCHHLMDPLGLPLEHFDAIGVHRATDNGLAIDASGDLDGRHVDGAASVASALRSDPAVPLCLARKVYRYATGHLDAPSEGDAVMEIASRFSASGFDWTKLLLAVVTSDGFRFASAPQ